MTDNNGHTGSQSNNSAESSRRQFLKQVTVVAGGVMTGLLGIPVLGFLLSPVLRREEEAWRDVGAIDDFAVDETVAVTFLDAAPLSWAGVAARRAAWLRRLDETTFVAFTVHCTHLGCPVRWQADARLFMCPCHGGVFNADGSVASGPLRAPLPGYPVRVRDGRVEILATSIPLAI